jgi:transketolase
MSRRAVCVPAAETTAHGEGPLTTAELAAFETFDMLYRSLCALLYNYVPTSGHPGG